MLESIDNTIRRFAMFQPGQKVGVAVSGGADSVCLLHVLMELAPRWNLRLSVLHLDHRLRGEESRGDAAFVADLAARFGLPFTLREVDVALSPDNLEQAARDIRLAFFREVIAAGEAGRVALGHTRSDQAETVLFRLLRGAGTGGLAGIRPVTAEGIVRPLIEVERSEVIEFLRARGLSWREDSTNSSLRFARNRIRHELLPQLEREWNPRIRETLATTAAWALAEEAHWEAEIDRLAADRLVERLGAVLMKTDALEGLSVAAARRLVRRAIQRVKGDLRAIDFRHVEAALGLIAAGEGHGRLQVPGVDIFRSFEWVRFGRPGADTLENRNYRVAAPVPGVAAVPGTGVSLTLEVIENPGATEMSDSVYNGCIDCIDWRMVSGSLELRNWRPGDQYQPVGSTGERKIKTLFQEGRIPLWERRHWPVLTDGSSILWARRFGPAARVAAGPGSTVLLRVLDAEGTKEESG